jgi:hypothetical protein
MATTNKQVFDPKRLGLVPEEEQGGPQGKKESIINKGKPVPEGQNVSDTIIFGGEPKPPKVALNRMAKNLVTDEEFIEKVRQEGQGLSEFQAETIRIMLKNNLISKA